MLRFVYIYQEVNLSETRFRYTYQDLHTRIKIRKYLLSYAYVHQDLHTSRFLHIYIKIHIIHRDYDRLSSSTKSNGLPGYLAPRDLQNGANDTES